MNTREPPPRFFDNRDVLWRIDENNGCIEIKVESSLTPDERVNRFFTTMPIIWKDEILETTSTTKTITYVTTNGDILVFSLDKKVSSFASKM